MRSKTLYRLSNRGGQAMVEYVLMLVVIVSLILGARKAFGVLNGFMDRYIGDYIVCLMEYGELPSLGVENTELKKHREAGGSGKVCDANFENFTFEKGVPAVAGTGSGGRSGSSGSSSGNSSSAGGSSGSRSGGGGGSTAKNNDSDKDSASDSSSSGGSSSRSGNRRSRASSPYDNGQITRSASGYGSGDASSESSNRRYLEDKSDEESRRKRRARASVRQFYNGTLSERSRYRAITGSQAAEVEKNLRPIRKPTASATGSVNAEQAYMLTPTKKIFTPPEKKPVILREEDGAGFKFGHIIRWLIIAGIVLAIIVFFGGQILNYSKSQGD